MLDDAVLYGRIILCALPFFILQFEFQSFFIVAEKPQMRLYVTLASGIANMIFDALFMTVFKWGIAGVALATALSQALSGIIPLVYFSRPNTSLLRFVKPSFDKRALLRACINGSSELMSNISMSLVGMLYNVQLLKYAGENGVVAYGVIMYVNMIFLAIFIGFSTGIASVVSFHFGAKNSDELKGLLKRSFMVIIISSVAMFISAEVLAHPLSAIFVEYDRELFEITVRGFLIYSFSFLFSGIAIFGSAFFTALNDGLTSALISFLRTLLFQIVAIIVFPLIWELDGIWLSVVAAEMMAVLMTFVFLAVKRKNTITELRYRHFGETVLKYTHRVLQKQNKRRAIALLFVFSNTFLRSFILLFQALRGMLRELLLLPSL